MRKVYQNESHIARLPVAIMLGVGFTAVLFGFIPFAHRVAKPNRALELRTANVVELPPPVEEAAPPPPPEAEKPPEAAPEPQLTETQQQIPLSADLEVALGSGGALAGFGEIRSLTAVEAVQDETVDSADLGKQPELIASVSPVYPAELSKAKVEGVVRVLFVVDEAGRVEDPRIESSPRPEFEKPTLDAIRKWRFSPGMKDGQPVRCFRSIPIRFRVPSG